MIGQNGTYFTPLNCIDPYFIIAGYTDDVICGDRLDVHDIRMELHHHLRAHGFDAVIFFDRNSMLTMYDMQSSYILQHLRVPTQEQLEAIEQDMNSGRDRSEPAPERPRGFVRRTRAAHEDRPQTLYTLNWGIVTDTAAWDRLKRLVQNTDIRTALIFTETQYMQMELTMQHQEVLMLLNRDRSENRSIAVFVVHSVADIPSTIGSGADLWRLFAHDVLLPRTMPGDNAPPEAYRIIELRTPNAAEIRNFLLSRRLRQENPLQIEMAQLNEISQQMAAICAMRRRSLSSLNMSVQHFIEQGDGRTLTLDTLPEITGEKGYRSVEQRLDNLVGMNALKEYIDSWRGYARHSSGKDGMPRYASRLTPVDVSGRVNGHALNLALVGEPGTGKSTAAEMIGALYRELSLLPTGNVVPRTGDSLISPNVGESARLVSAAVQEAMGGVLLIDEAYMLIDNQFGTDVINSLVYNMGRYAGRFAVILAGYKEPVMRLLSANDGLFRRVPNVIELEHYTPEQMLEIFRRMVAGSGDMAISPELDAELDNFFQGWVRNGGPDWGNAGEAETLVTAMRKHCSLRTSQPGAELVLMREDIPEELQRWLKPRSTSLQEALDTMNEIAGMDDIKNFLRKLARSMALSDKREEPGAYVFHGAPGTGKTMMAGKMAELLNQLGILNRCVPVIYSANELLSPPKRKQKPGEHPDPNGNSLQEAVESARGSILFIDEAHQLADSDRGRLLLRDLVPIIESTEFRSTTGIILAGYTVEMNRLFEIDTGLNSRFPERNRIRFKNYTADELVHIMEGMAKDIGQSLEPEFIERSRSALSAYLATPKQNFGNARFIRNTYLPGACSQRDIRIVREYVGDLPLSVELTPEMAAEIPDKAKVTLTGADLPVLGSCNFQALAGPLGAKPLPRHTAEYLLKRLYDKEDVISFVHEYTQPESAKRFAATGAGTSMHYTIAGPLGSGRRTIVTAVANAFAEAGLVQSREVYVYTKGDLEAGYVGQTAQRTRSAINMAQGGTVVISGVSSMLSRENENSFGPEAISEVFNCMEAYGDDTCFVFIDMEAGMEAFLKAYPQARGTFARHFALEDLTVEAMQRIFRDKAEHRFAFVPTVNDMLDDFVVNWVVDRGGLGGDFNSWNNGLAIEQLMTDLDSAFERLEGRELTDADGYPVREITLEMFPDKLKKYMKPARVVMETAMQELDDLTGLTRVKQRVKEIETTFRLGNKANATPGLYCFLGNPGVGKTKVAELMGGVLRAVGALSQGYVISRTARQMCDQLDSFEKILRMARNNVLFIDEAHQLSENRLGNEVIKRLLTALEDLDVIRNTCIILAGYPREMMELLAMDRGLSSRLENGMIYFDDYTVEELTSIMYHMAANPDRFPQIGARTVLNLNDERCAGFVQGAREIFDGVLATHNSNFGNARFVRNLLHNSVVCQFMRLDAQYGCCAEIPEEVFSILLEADLPKKDNALRSRSKRERAWIPASKLPVGTIEPITDANLRDRFEQLRVSTVLIHVEREDGSDSGSGSVIREDGLILTCAHVVADAKKLRVRFFCPGMPGGDIRWYDCAVLDPIREDIDMALIKVEGGANFPTVALRAADESISESEATMIVGYPFGSRLDSDLDRLRPNHFEGRISSIQRRGKVDEICYVDSAGKGGNSGSPVFSREDGRVIGVFDGSDTQRLGNGDLIEELNHFRPIHLFWESFVNHAQ